MNRNLKIDSYSFGNMVIEGITYTSDLKIIRDRVVDSWWRHSGHVVDIDDLRDILTARPEILVLGRGKPGLMRSTERLRERLAAENIKLYEESSAKAVKIFNKLWQEGRDVAAGFHLTC